MNRRRFFAGLFSGGAAAALGKLPSPPWRRQVGIQTVAVCVDGKFAEVVPPIGALEKGFEIKNFKSWPDAKDDAWLREA